MSTPTTNSSSSLPSLSNVDLIQAVIRPSVNMMLLGVAWTAALLPLLLALFFFSTKAWRRKPVFIFNVLSIFVGICFGILEACYMYHLCFYPPNENIPGFPVVAAVILGMSSLLVESVLFCRLLAVYPYHSTPKRTFTAIFLSLLLLKVGRFANLCVYVDTLAFIVDHSGPTLNVNQVAWHIKGNKIEWILQLFDNSVSSFLFLKKFDFRGALSNRRGSVDNLSRCNFHSSKLQTLFYIAASNFIFPLFLNIALLVHSFQRNPDVVTGSYILISDFYVQIIGVLLATVWAAGVQWTEEKYRFSVPTFVLPTIQHPSCGEITPSITTNHDLDSTTPNDDHKSCTESV